MPRLIDADALKNNAVELDLPFPPFNHRSKEQIVFLYDIDDAPTIDAEPVRHGRWLPETVSGYDGVNVVYARPCSECGYEERRFVKRYCPNCGAKMDLEVE